MSTALLTDRYELTMIDAALRDGTAARPCVFELFARRLPDGRRYPTVNTVQRAFARAGLSLELKPVLMFNCCRASWAPTDWARSSGSAGGRNSPAGGTSTRSWRTPWRPCSVPST